MNVTSTLKSLTALGMLTLGLLATGCSEIAGPEIPAQDAPESGGNDTVVSSAIRVVPRPDLIVSEIREYKGSRSYDRWVFVTVKNVGLAWASGSRSGIDVLLQARSPEGISSSVVSTFYEDLAPGHYRTVGIRVSCNRGAYDWRAMADSGTDVGESNESNNASTLRMALHNRCD
jgi:subtilase family serine protease